MKEECPKCRNQHFAIARDMLATRHCKCGHTWLPKPKVPKKPKCPKCGKSGIYLDDQDKGNGFWKLGCNSCGFQDERTFEKPIDAIEGWMTQGHS